jgi:uncharacterized membrane protein
MQKTKQNRLIKKTNYENLQILSCLVNALFLAIFMGFNTYMDFRYTIPRQRFKKDFPLDILKKRLVSSEISTNEYQEKKYA